MSDSHAVDRSHLLYLSTQKDIAILDSRYAKTPILAWPHDHRDTVPDIYVHEINRSTGTKPC